MTPQKKASELIEKFTDIENEYNEYTDYKQAKQCALIAVDEIIEETPELVPEETFIEDSCGVDYFINERYKYWEEVKNEINKL